AAASGLLTLRSERPPPRGPPPSSHDAPPIGRRLDVDRPGEPPRACLGPDGLVEAAAACYGQVHALLGEASRQRRDPRDALEPARRPAERTGRRAEPARAEAT